MPKEKLNKFKQIINKLDEIIAIAQPKSRTVSLHQDVIIKLLPSIAIASFGTYISYQQYLDLQFNVPFAFVYLGGLIGFAFYINTYPGKIVIKNTCLILVTFGAVYYLLEIVQLWNLSKNSYYSFLYIIDYLIMLTAVMFSLLNSFSYNHRYIFILQYTDKILFDVHRYLIMSNLIKFDNQEINSALLRLKNIKDRLSKKTDRHIRNNNILHLLIFLGSILISSLEAIIQSTTWLDLAMTTSSIILVLASAIMIFLVIKNIPHTRREVHIRQRWLILIQYKIERLKSTNFLFENELNSNA